MYDSGIEGGGDAQHVSDGHFKAQKESAHQPMKLN